MIVCNLPYRCISAGDFFLKIFSKRFASSKKVSTFAIPLERRAGFFTEIRDLFLIGCKEDEERGCEQPFGCDRPSDEPDAADDKKNREARSLKRLKD